MNHRGNKRFGKGKMLFFIPIIILVVFGVGYIVMQLWNNVLHEVVPVVTTITYWQAMGLLVLSKILFGGFHGGGGKHHRHKDCKHDKMRNLKDKWDQMDDAQREKIKQEWFGKNNDKSAETQS